MTDSTTCEQWGSANVNRQDAYARLYVCEHGAVSPRWGPVPIGVINAINAGCYQAFGEDVADTGDRRSGDLARLLTRTRWTARRVVPAEAAV